MSQNRIEITIAVRPHLAKYVNSHFRAQDGCLYVDARSALGTFFYGMVEPGAAKAKPKGHTLTLALPAEDRHGQAYDGRSVGLHINDVNVARVNEFLDFIFRKELFARLDMLQERGEVKRKSGKVKAEIVGFMQKYDITEEDLTLDALKKSYYRYRESGKLLIEQVI